MEAESTKINYPSDLYPGMKVLKTRDVSSFINRFAHEEEEKLDNVFQFERIDNIQEVTSTGWFDRLFNYARGWVEEDLA